MSEICSDCGQDKENCDCEPVIEDIDLDVEEGTEEDSENEFLDDKTNCDPDSEEPTFDEDIDMDAE